MNHFDYIQDQADKQPHGAPSSNKKRKQSRFGLDLMVDKEQANNNHIQPYFT